LLFRSTAIDYRGTYVVVVDMEISKELNT